MGVKESIERWLFWTERTGFLILSLAWSLMDTPNFRGLLRKDIFWDCTTYLKLFWKCTNLLYFLLWACKRLSQSWEKRIGHTAHSLLPQKYKTGVNGDFLFELLPLLIWESGVWLVENPGFLLEQLARLICEGGVWFVKNPGFFLERLAVLIWALYIGVPQAYWIHNSSCMIIFPLLNIYFAWTGYSSEFKRDLYHHQKKLSDGKNITRTATEESIKQQHSTDVYGRAARVLFWVERLGFAILTLSWFCFSIVQRSSRNLLLNCINIVGCFWVCSNLLYCLVCFGRLLAENDVYNRPQLQLQGNEIQKLIMSCLWFLNNFKDHPGFWLERLALLLLAYGLDFLRSPTSRPGGLMVLDSCVTIIFPLFHMYFAGFGYSNEFQNTILVKKVVKLEKGIAKEEIQQRQKLAPSDSLGRPAAKLVQSKHQSDEAKNLMMDNKDDSSYSTSSATNDLMIMLESLEDRIHMKIVNTMEEIDRQKYLAKCDDAWQTALTKVVEKYEEENQSLKKQNSELAAKLSVATASSQLYSSLLHDNMCIYNQ